MSNPELSLVDKKEEEVDKTFDREAEIQRLIVEKEDLHRKVSFHKEILENELRWLREQYVG